jgi:hypothetical protein
MRKIVRDRILKRDGNKCRRCLGTENLEIDHIIPLSKGGRHDEDNFQVLCRTCNRKKSNKFEIGKFFKVGVNPEYILIDPALADYMAELNPSEFKSIFQLKMKENDIFFGNHQM